MFHASELGQNVIIICGFINIHEIFIKIKFVRIFSGRFVLYISDKTTICCGRKAHFVNHLNLNGVAAQC